MGATPTYALPYPEATDPPAVPADLAELATAVEDTIEILDGIIRPKMGVAQLTPGASGQVVTTVGGAAAWANVPTAQTAEPMTVAQLEAYAAAGGVPQGKTVLLVLDDALGVYWTLHYDSTIATAQKWRGGGGWPLRSTKPGETTSAAPTGVWQAMPGVPVVTAPLAGIYEVRGRVTGEIGGTGQTVQARANAGAAGAVALGTNAVGVTPDVPNPAGFGGAGVLTLAKGQTVTLEEQHSFATTWSLHSPILELRPVRLQP
jgi:hypothetical protein